MRDQIALASNHLEERPAFCLIPHDSAFPRADVRAGSGKCRLMVACSHGIVCSGIGNAHDLSSEFTGIGRFTPIHTRKVVGWADSMVSE